MTLHTVPTRIGHNRPPVRGRSYAIIVDLDPARLERYFPRPDWREGSSEVRGFLEDRGFERGPGSMYWAEDGAGPVQCVVAVQELSEAFAWLTPSLEGLRMLRIEENSDLMPALNRTRP